jgi:hypothetical protein
MINFISLLILAAAGGFLVWFGKLWLKAAQFAQDFEQQLTLEGIETQAEVMDTRMVAGSKSAAYYLTLKYRATMPDGKPQNFTSEVSVSHGDHVRFTPGDEVTIRYLPSNPKSMRLGAEIQQPFNVSSIRLSGQIVVAIGVVTMLMGVVVFISSTANDNAKAAAATATTLQRSATPNTLQKTATVRGATATAQTDQAAVSKIQVALASRIPNWKQVTDRAIHWIPFGETNLNMGEIEIDYGYCANGAFYVYVWLRITDRLNLGYEYNTFFAGYGYVEGSTPPNCYPKELAQVWLRNSGSLGNDWYAVSGATVVKLPLATKPSKQ